MKSKVSDLSKEQYSLLCYFVGYLLLRAPRVAVLMGHSASLSTIKDYLRPVENEQLEMRLASEFVNELVSSYWKKDAASEMADKWSPSAEEVVSALDSGACDVVDLLVDKLRPKRGRL